MNKNFKLRAPCHSPLSVLSDKVQCANCYVILATSNSYLIVDSNPGPGATFEYFEPISGGL